MADKIEVMHKMMAGATCAQTTLAAFADRFDFAEEELMSISAAFRGGMQRGDTCGAVTGALMVLGLEYSDDDGLLHEKVSEFQQRFTERWGSTYCRELLGYDYSVPGERDKCVAAGIEQERCPGFVHSAIEILEEMLEQ